MKLFKVFADTGYHTSIVTTFGVDFDAYESIALARLREAGCRNNVLIADGRMLAHAMNDLARRPRLAGRSYSVVGAQPKGVFHPKLILQLGKTKGRLLVASANMTSPGLAGNLEVVGCVDSDEEDRSGSPMLQAALSYLSGFIEPGSVSASQLATARQLTTWLPLAAGAAGAAVADLGESGQATFLASNSSEGIGSRFRAMVGNQKVKRLVIVSPYWDADLSALKQLRKSLSPAQTSVLLQRRAALFPAEKLPADKKVALYDADSIGGAGASRFAHAKVLIAETASADYVLYGSANCTTAALGTEGGRGINEEASLVRVLGAGEAVQILGMESALEDWNVLDASELKYAPAVDIPMQELEVHLPGRFELTGTMLRWWPPQKVDVAAASIQLFDESSKELPVQPRRLGESVSPVSFECKTSSIPCFAKVTAPGFESSLGIIVIDEAIRVAQRPPAKGAAKSKMEMLFDEEAFEGLWLIEVMQKLDEAERRIKSPSSAKTPRAPKQSSTASAPDPVTYEQFIARRKSSHQTTIGTSRLASSNQESVRGFLNFLLGGNHSHRIAVEDETPAPTFSMGDETSDDTNPLEQDARFEADTQATDEDKAKRDALIVKRRQEFQKDTQASIAKHVEGYIKRTRDEAQERLLTVVDLLKLRVLLLVILGSGSKLVNVLSKDITLQTYRRQVLPSYGHNNWNWLIRRLLHLFFLDPFGPCIDRVTLGEDQNQELPEDVLECWATCYWALCATRVSKDSRGISETLGAAQEALASALLKGIGLASPEATNDRVQAMFSAMDERYGERLGVASGAPWDELVRLLGSSQQSSS